MKQIALDTSVAIEILNDNAHIIRQLLDFDDIYLPAIVCGELLYGVVNSRRIHHHLFRYNSFIADCKILEVSNALAAKYADIKKCLKVIGKPIPENDLWIAAICAASEVPLFTLDKHFAYISEVQIVSKI